MKNNPFQYIFWIVVVVAIILLIRTCNSCEFFGGKRQDTVSVKVDTIWAASKSDTVYIPQLLTVTHTKTIYQPVYRTDTLETFEVLPTDTAAILARYYQKAFYSDTQKVQYGQVIIQDTVTTNRIVSRRFQTSFNIPVVEKTVTLTQPKRIIAYIGVSGIGSFQNPLYAIGGDFSLKGRNDRIYSIGAMATKDGAYYSAGFKLPIRLTKK